jgi:uncharacterized membrane protein YfcA
MTPLVLPEFTPTLLLAIGAIALLGYVLFGATGFGSSAVGVPLLAHFLPVAACVPLMSAVDIFAATGTSWRNRHTVAWAEFRRLAPSALIGIALGATLLVRLSAAPALIALGVFVTVYGTYVLLGAPRPRNTPAWLAWPVGLVGGFFSALFGSGGPVYVTYLSARIEDKSVLRATVASMLAMSVWLRVVMFVITGVLLDVRLLMLAAALAPVMLLGLYLGHALHMRLTNASVLRFIAALLVINGVTLLARALG